jgi:hypothetical protein
LIIDVCLKSWTLAFTILSLSFTIAEVFQKVFQVQITIHVSKRFQRIQA